MENAGYFVRHSVQFQWNNPVFADFEGFLATLPQKRRTQIRRERRAVHDAGIVVKTLVGDRLDARARKAAFDFYQATVSKFAWGRQYLNERFFELLFARWNRLEGNRVELVIAERDGDWLGGALNIFGPGVGAGGSLYGRYWGARDDVKFLHFEVCYYHSIDDCIRRKIGHFSPGAGGEHKIARGFLPALTYSAHWIAHPRFAAIVRESVVRERQAIAMELASHAAAK
jgi:predicted N-acyltransferase